MATLVIVDDSSFMRKMLREIVTKAGHEVLGEGGDGAAGLDLYETHRPDVLTLDLAMPVMGGQTALETLKARHPAAKVVMCSSQVRDDVIHQSLASGASAFIGKPFQAEDVLQTLARVLG